VVFIVIHSGVCLSIVVNASDTNALVDQTISQTLDNLTVVELPCASRNVYTFLYLNPNVTQSAANGSFEFIGKKGANNGAPLFCDKCVYPVPRVGTLI